MAFGIILKEIAKAVLVGSAIEVVREQVIPPLSEKVKKKLKSIKEKEDQSEKAEPVAKEYEADWQ